MIQMGNGSHATNRSCTKLMKVSMSGKPSGYAKVRINTTISGEPAKWLTEWKERGLIVSNTDAILQAFRILHEHIVEGDIKNAQRRTARSAQTER